MNRGHLRDDPGVWHLKLYASIHVLMKCIMFFSKTMINSLITPNLIKVPLVSLFFFLDFNSLKPVQFGAFTSKCGRRLFVVV